MAWDNPHGTLSADERLRLEREAKIFAEAQREMLRQEQKRAEREAERYSSTSTGHKTESFPRVTISMQPPPPRIPTPAEIAKEERIVREMYEERIAKIRARNALEAPYGSAEYIHSRYGHKTWTTKIAEYMEDFQCTEEEAVRLICRSYKEEEWRAYEIERVEKLLRERYNYKEDIMYKRGIESRVRWAKEKTFGSRDYLRGRYGQGIWEKKLKEVQDAQGCTRPEASAILVATYKEEDWRIYENDEVEKLLGNRPE